MSPLATERIVLATGDALFEDRLRRAFAGELNGSLRMWDASQLVGDPTRAARRILADEPDVVAVGPQVPLESALELVRTLDLMHPGVTVMLVAEPTPHVLEHALRAGVREVVAPASDDAVLVDAFRRVAETAMRRRATFDGAAAAPTGSVICIVSPKGGAGKTTVATNLSVGLAMRAPGQVALVDLDVQFGDVAPALRLEPETSIVDAIRTADRLDETTVKAFLTPHDSGLFVLGAPENPAAADEINARQTSAVVKLLTGMFPYVVIDTGSGLDEHTLAALDLATEIVLVLSSEVPTIRAARKEVEILRSLGLDDRRWHVVLNRAESRVGLDSADIALSVGVPVDVAVPSARSVPLSINQGTPVVLSDERAPVSRAFRTLIDRFRPDIREAAPTAAETRSRFTLRRAGAVLQ